ncbi:MAG: DUF4199 domain-containing protein [Flavobacteriales bacterium]|nr:DUF4199 domain-containing protein [Flavobacteriales bacterium]
MFKNPFQIAITFAVIALIIKVSVFAMDAQHGSMENYIWYMYMLILLFSVFFGIRSNKIMYEGTTTFGQDFKTGARTASFFGILMGAITYFYYAKIDPEFFPIKQQPYIDGLIEMAREKVKEGVSKDEVTTGLRESISAVKQQLSPYLHSMLTMFGLVFIGLFNSLVFSFLMKKYPGFKK